MGHPDGQHLPWAEMLDAVGRMARAVQVPVTADIEAGFAADVKQLESSIAQVIAAGAVGVVAALVLAPPMPQLSQSMPTGSGSTYR
jgi:2-methylisocitrate lyase-like PEP mutase family enzyme